METNTQTTNYIENYSNNTNSATVILNPAPSLTENYGFLKASDYVGPGLDSMIT